MTFTEHTTMATRKINTAYAQEFAAAEERINAAREQRRQNDILADALSNYQCAMAVRQAELDAAGDEARAERCSIAGLAALRALRLLDKQPIAWRRGGERQIEVQSASQPDVWYTVQVGRCSCPSPSKRGCWHRAVLGALVLAKLVD
jgi:hypothetical protein